VRELEDEAAPGDRIAAPEQRCVALGGGTRPLPVPGPQPSRQLPVTTTGQRDQPLGVLLEQRLGEPRDRLRARTKALDWERARADVRPFLERERDIDLVTLETLGGLLGAC